MVRSLLCRPGLLQVALFAATLGIVSGCGKNDGKKADGGEAKNNAVEAKKKSPSVTPVKATGPLAHLHQPFKDAVSLDPPEGEERPPDKTAAGKNTTQMFEQIAGSEGKGGLWEQIRFTTPEGKRIRYQAVIKTDLGDIQLAFFPDEAPNHVRNFIALAKVHYYDGLPFHHLVKGKVSETPFAYLDTGCPVGTGEAGHGSIGYWMNPELSDKLTHEEGTIGATYGLNLESAACKFYITLTKAPWMDGRYSVFAKISQGLDVARKISEKPVEPLGDGFHRFTEAVLIREVLITSTVEDVQVAHSP